MQYGEARQREVVQRVREVRGRREGGEKEVVKREDGSTGGHLVCQKEFSRV
jgi:hypothetical protein